ncbi:hypothetical protein DDJ70_04890 [Klebsiella michiganensis]|uniref:Uncharacterized protein n=1 Tax=Klebsiella michiganensis TaxID=1134687 RepID=A0A2J4ZHU4_9ENTR|nr:hypothetical protein CWM85_14430 [Klebsiella michiganensis]RFC12656.1 hypothetical protein DDJ70_04890 [Klebsiella michiganensis]
MVLYPSYFKLHVRWLHSLTPVTYSCKLLGTPSLAAFLQLELFRVYRPVLFIIHRHEVFTSKRGLLRCSVHITVSRVIGAVHLD